MAQSANMVGITRTRYFGTSTAHLQARSDLETQMISDFDNVFFNQNEFGNTVSYNHYGFNTTQTYKCIKDDPTQDIRASSNTEILGVKPNVMLSTAHMKIKPHINDIIIKDNIRYGIDSFEDDGVGTVVIYLIREDQRLN